uniref:Uncharacterized protein n=1 Tax=Rhizophora mucronata TaxID=61149 RepID=A0A2P2PBE4_RHIMU
MVLVRLLEFMFGR